MKKIIIIALATVLLYSIYKIHINEKSNSDSGLKKNILIIGLSPDYAPMAYKTSNDEIIGFDVDLINIICKKLNIKYILEELPFDTLISSLQLNKIDIAISGISPTTNRKKVIDFSNPYLQGDTIVALYKKENEHICIHKTDDLSKYNLVLNTGYHVAETLRELEFTNFIELISIPECLQSLEANRADAYIIDKTSADIILKERSDLNFTYSTINDFNNSTSTAIGFSKKANILILEFNKIITELKEDGTLKELCCKWEISDELI